MDTVLELLFKVSRRLRPCLRHKQMSYARDDRYGDRRREDRHGGGNPRAAARTPAFVFFSPVWYTSFVYTPRDLVKAQNCQW